MDQVLPGVVDGTYNSDLIKKKEIPFDRYKDVTYGQVFCNYQEEETYPYQERVVVGGDIINYPGNAGKPTEDMLSVNLLLNSVVSTPGAKFSNACIRNFYLMTPLKRK